MTHAVVAGPAQAASRWSPEDLHLVAELPAGLPVHRSTEELELSDLRLKRLLGRPTGAEAWWARALQAPAEEAIAACRPDVQFVALSPFAALGSVLEHSARHGLPIVADLRDPWARDEVTVYPSRWAQGARHGRDGATARALRAGGAQHP